jgi:hypothetical protein
MQLVDQQADHRQGPRQRPDQHWAPGRERRVHRQLQHLCPVRPGPLQGTNQRRLLLGFLKNRALLLHVPLSGPPRGPDYQGPRGGACWFQKSFWQPLLAAAAGQEVAGTGVRGRAAQATYSTCSSAGGVPQGQLRDKSLPSSSGGNERRMDAREFYALPPAHRMHSTCNGAVHVPAMSAGDREAATRGLPSRCKRRCSGRA